MVIKELKHKIFNFIYVSDNIIFTSEYYSKTKIEDLCFELIDNKYVYKIHVKSYEKIKKNKNNVFTVIDVNFKCIKLYIKDFKNITIFNSSIYYDNSKLSLKKYFNEEEANNIAIVINSIKLANKIKDF